MNAALPDTVGGATYYAREGETPQFYCMACGGLYHEQAREAGQAWHTHSCAVRGRQVTGAPIVCVKHIVYFSGGEGLLSPRYPPLPCAPPDIVCTLCTR